MTEKEKESWIFAIEDLADTLIHVGLGDQMIRVLGKHVNHLEDLPDERYADVYSELNFILDDFWR